MDLVGQLLNSAQGHEYILVIINYANRYLEATPLCKTTSKTIVRVLMHLFSHVGSPKDLLIHQGTPFISNLMVELCWLLQVKELCASVYHPKTHSLVEGFNQTFKRMLLRVLSEESRDWDLLLPYVLFAVWEPPRALTGFTLFELLFRQSPWNLQEHMSPFRSIVEFMQDRLAHVTPIVKDHMQVAQREQQ